MINYFIVLSIFGVVSLKDLLKIQSLNNKIFDCILLSILIIFVGFRYNCDNDYINYVGIYESTPTLFNIKDIFSYSMTMGIEIGYLLVSSLLKTLNFGTQSIFVFSAIVTFCFLYAVAKRHTQYPAIALFTFFCQYFSLPFIQMRFGISLAIGLYGCSSLYLGRRKIFFVFIVLAASFHTSALGLFIFFIFNNIDWVKKSYLIYIILIICLFILLFVSFGKILGAIMTRLHIKKYINYVNSGIANPRALFVAFFSMYPFILFRNRLNKKSVDVNFFLTLGLGGLFVGSIVWQQGILSRFSMINTSVLFMIVPSYLLLFEKGHVRIIAYYILLLYCVLKFIPNLDHITSYTSSIVN
jgi:hypothetical protein